MNLEAILESAALLRSHRTRLRASLDRLQSVKAGALTRLERLEAENEGYARLMRRGKERERELADFEGELLTPRTQFAGVSLFNLERALPSLDADVRAFRKVAVQPPSAIDWYLTRTGGQRIKLSDQTELLIDLLDEQRRVRFRTELADAPPSTVRDLYAAAVESDSDEAGSLVRHVEAKYGNGWAGPAPANDGQIQQAKELQRLIASTRDSRVPPELADIEPLLEQCGRLVNRAQQAYGVRPINPDQPGYDSARVAYESELRAIAEQQPELVEQ